MEVHSGDADVGLRCGALSAGGGGLVEWLSFIWFEWESLLPPMWGWRWDWGASLMKALSPTWPAGVRVCGVVVWRV